MRGPMAMRLPTIVDHLYEKRWPWPWLEIGRFSSRFLAVPKPFLDPNGQKLGFDGQKRLNDHRQRRTRRPQHHPCPSGRHVQAGVTLEPTVVPLAVIF
jgi:hypothetical protein